jgi:hypothetical protein
VAQQVASAANAVHHFTENGIPAIAHTDITPSQWVYIESDQRYKLNDFNRCRFLLWDEGKNETCTFEVGSNPGIVSDRILCAYSLACRENTLTWLPFHLL